MSAQSCETVFRTEVKDEGENVQVDDGSLPTKTKEEISDGPTESDGDNQRKGFESESSEGSVNTRSRVALENAASVASMLLTTECIIADIPEDEKPHSHGAPDMGGMGGMM